MEEIAIKVDGVSKKFCTSLRRSMFYGALDVMRNIFGIHNETDQLRKDEFWALKNISFELRKGDTLGIIGKNGSGKSTLLRILNGIYPPDKGRVEISGKVGAMIALGAGFHPHFTGRENVFLNGTILGMSSAEIRKKFQSILDFAEIGDFIDAPVSTYSSGMVVRLGFGIAIHCEPDILIVDEVLSVGDMGFRNKSIRFMQQFREKASSIIFVSHNTQQVEALCKKVLVLDKGELIFYGETREGILIYEDITQRDRLENFKKENKNSYSVEKNVETLLYTDLLKVTDIGMLDSNNDVIDTLALGEPLRFFCDFNTTEFIEGIYLNVTVQSDMSPVNFIHLISKENPNSKLVSLERGKYRIVLTIEDNRLGPGIYKFHLNIRNSITEEMYERFTAGYPFHITSHCKIPERGVMMVEEKWDITKIG